MDELDEVKTDGEFVYISSYDSVKIVRAYPAEALSNVSTINESSILGHDDPNIYLSFSGIFVLPQKLIVVCSWTEYIAIPVMYDYGYSEGGFAASQVIGDESGPRSYVMVYDISDPEHPDIDFAVGVTGYVQSARMIDDRVYLIANQYQWLIGSNTLLPRTWVGDNSDELAIDKIFYDPEMRDPAMFLNILAVNISSGDNDCVSLVAGYASTIYMSKQALYLSVQKWVGDIGVVRSDSEALAEDTTTTTIFKISFDGLSMKATARGDVKGWLLNQFSMDEKEPYLRVATTSTWFSPSNGTAQGNSVFVLDSSLQIVGTLTGIAPTERIYSVRFVNDTLYMVTFRQVDPLFVINLSDPTNPKIAGELQMPGFSNYLHPVDETHMLGIGSESSMIKVSLYNVSDPTAPTEQSKFILDGFRYSYSSAQYDHKAVLFDLEKNLLVIPMSGYGEVFFNGEYWETTYVSGALVLNVSVEEGIHMRGIIIHETGKYNSQENVWRSLYIGENLYTISSSIVKASSLADLSEISSLIYRENDNYRYIMYVL